MRVNIEEGAWKRIYKMADATGFSVRECAGTVACLWSNSQDAVRVSGSREEIIEWADLFKLSPEQIEKWINGLEKAPFISNDKNGTFKIHGNDIQLAAIAKRTHRASKGGQALRKKMREHKRLKALQEQSPSIPQDAKRGSIQFNSKHYNSKQFNSDQSESELAEFSTDPIFQFLETISSDNIHIEPNLVKAIVKRIFEEVHPSRSKAGAAEAIASLVEELNTVDGIKWFWKATRAYRAYCEANSVSKIFGLKKFSTSWVNWLSKSERAGA